MNNRKKLFFFAVFLLFIFLMYKLFNTSEYDRQVKSFKKVSVSEIKDNIENKKDFILYLGRKTCPDCVDFVPLLSKVAKENDLEILYLDTERGINHKEIKKFRKEYEILYVPTLMIQKDKTIYFPEIPLEERELEDIFHGLGYF